MDVLTLMAMKDSLMTKIEVSMSEWKDINQKMEEVVNKIISNRGCVILGLSFFFIFLEYPLLDVSIGGFLLYGGSLLSRYMTHRVEKEKMDSIDIEKIGLSTKKEGPHTVTDLIGEYVEDCFNRDVLFFHPIKDSDFVDAKTEREMLEELLDSAASNMSPLLIKKLELYVGEGNVMRIVGRKCLTTITIFVASHNHRLYDGHSSR